MRPRNGLSLPYPRFVILRNSGRCRLCGICHVGTVFRESKRAGTLGFQPFSLVRVGGLNSMNVVSFNHGVAETLILLGCAVLLSHVVLVFSRILLPICYQRPSPCSVAYVRESNGSAGSGCSVLDASPGYSEMVRSYSEVVPGWCAGL